MANNLQRLHSVNNDDFFQNFGLTHLLHSFGVEPNIKMDVMQTDEGYTVKAEIPGVKKEDIEVAIDGNQLSISAEIEKEAEKKNYTMIQSERCIGRQSRRITFAHDIDETKAIAKYEEGILELLLPKKSGADKLKKLTIN